jgi:DNA-binding Lrp family transcriptional regulator
MEGIIAYPHVTEVQKKVRAFLLLETPTADKTHIIRTISQLPGVVSVDGVNGVYDVIATIEGNNLDEIGNLVVTQMHHVINTCRYAICLVTPLKELQH